jgi:anthranilate/para-aminobenzoate synthase component II
LEAGAEVLTFRNDEITLDGLPPTGLSGLVVSPVLEGRDFSRRYRHFAGKLPILGVCLGLERLAPRFGGSIIRSGSDARQNSVITTTQRGVFAHLPVHGQPLTTRSPLKEPASNVLESPPGPTTADRSAPGWCRFRAVPPRSI